MKRVATGIFFVALLLNVKITLDGPYFLVGHELAAETTGTDSGTATDTQTGSETSGGSGWFWQEKLTSITCLPVNWKKTVYKNSSGITVGEMLVENGIVRYSYSGSYAYTAVTSGTTPERKLDIKQCPDGWNPFCQKCLDPCFGCD